VASKKKSEDDLYQEVIDKLDRQSSLSEIEETLQQLWANYQARPDKIWVDESRRALFEKTIRGSGRKRKGSSPKTNVKGANFDNRPRRRKGK